MQIGTLQSCKGSKSVGELNTCFRNSIVTGFDTSGRGAGACGSIEDLGKFASCIMEGNLAMSFYSLMPAGEVEPMTDSDWLDPKPYVDRLDIAMTLQVTKSCLEASASDTAGYVRDKIENFLNLSASDRQRCDTVQPAADFKQCVAEAIGVRTLREGTARITAKSI